MRAPEPGDGHGAGALVAGYRPWLDGIRAVAVLMVVVQHMMGATRLNLGFTGVGIFFGLSGYLITSLLLDERADRGSVSLSRFYLRRAARLVPALLLVLAVCDLVFLAQGDLTPLRGSIPAATYTTNYVQVLDDDFVKAYGPTWSLAVEEHFYVLWPLALLWMVRRGGLRLALRLTLVACLASLSWRIVLAVLHAPPILLSVGSLERADALLYGCAAAIALRLGWRPRRWVVWLGIAVIGASTAVFNAEPYPVLIVSSAVIGVASAAVVVGMDYAAPTWMRQVLSWRPVVFIGVISYGIYLWHGPLMRIVQNATETGRAWRLLAALLAIAVAALSYRFVEAPIRAAVRRRTGRVRASAPDRDPADGRTTTQVAEPDAG